MRPLGRPMKYHVILRQLEDDVLYSPGTISGFAKEHGLLLVDGEEPTSPAETAIAMRRIRISMGRFATNHGFPDVGDGLVHVKTRAPTPGWFGWRWKSAIPR